MHLHTGPRLVTCRNCEAGHTTVPDRMPNRSNIMLAPMGASTYGETATGRDKQPDLGLRLAGECVGLSLVEADMTLDNARRYVWLRSFSGASNDALDREITGVPNFAVSRRIVDHLAGIVTHIEAEQVFLEALRTVPRHLYGPKYLRNQAYENRPLPIGHGQTISQPSIVALMTELLELDAGDRVLEIGTGSGYQAAILAALATRVHTIEIIEPIFRQVRNRFHRMGQMSIETRHGDGYYGWPEAQPFDGIIVTAASDHVPPPLIKQLAHGGRMIIPVGDRFTTQQLLMIHKDLSGKVTTRHVLPVIFVPLTGEC